MGKFVKEGILGGYKEVDEGYADRECTHVILTKSEYERLLQEKRDAEIERDNALIHLERELRAAEDAADVRLREAQQEAGRQIGEVSARQKAAEQEAEYQRGLNETLLRISRERANADRKLKPKKRHSGYVVVSSTEKEYHYRTEYKERAAVRLWETVIQSPYTVDFTEEQAEKLIAEEFVSKDNNWLVAKVGITANYHDSYEKMLQDKRIDEAFLERNVMFPRKLRANFRTGYWETFFLHTKPLGVVPADMRARQ